MSTNPWAASCIHYGMEGYCSMLCDFHVILCKSLTLQLPPPYNKRPSFMLYGRCDKGGCSSLTNSLSHIVSPIWLKDFEVWVQKTLFHCSVIQSLCSLAHWSLLIFFASLPMSFSHLFCHTSQLHRVFSSPWMLTSLRRWFSSTVMFGAVHLLSRKLRWNCPLHTSNRLYLASSNSTQYGQIWVQVLVSCDFRKTFNSYLVLKKKNASKSIFQKYLVILRTKLLKKTCILYDK